MFNSNLSRNQFIATPTTTETDIKNFIISSIKNGQRSFGIAAILNSENIAFFGEAGNFIVIITGDTANYGFTAENLWNGKLWTGRFATYMDDWSLTECAMSSNLDTKLPYMNNDSNITADLTVYNAKAELAAKHVDGRVLKVIFDFPQKRISTSYHDGTAWNEKTLAQW